VDHIERKQVWNRDFILLWQGQLVSAVGTVAFNIAVGFWILRETGSSTIMGSVIALAALFQVLGGPIGGVLADRWSRKRIIVLSDLFAGVLIMAGAALAFTDVLTVWMVLVGAAALGANAALFRPAVNASIPDLVPEPRLDKGNSAFGIIQQLSGIIGNSVGGALFALLGAPVVFLINGVTFVISSISEAFMRLPVKHKPTRQAERESKDGAPDETKEADSVRTAEASKLKRLASELADGLRFVWHNPVLKLQLLNLGMLNLFLTMGGVLYLPFFERSDQFAPTDYGLTMALLTGGALAGLLVLQIADIPNHRRFTVFTVLAFLFGVSRTLIITFPRIPVILGFAFISGFAVAIINTIVISTLQGLTPPEMRGKLFGLVGSFAGALIPLGTAIGGVLGDLFPIQLVVPVTGAIATVGFLPLILSKRVARAYAGEGRLSTTEQAETDSSLTPPQTDT
jgi:MFS family permease